MATLDELIAQVNEGIAMHQQGEDGPFSEALLQRIVGELERMRQSADYEPIYPRFVLDWPDVSAELGKALMRSAYERSQALKRRA
ncbi:hypothetical protein OK349_13175 [Sphingomonas sp. BT-65]|uniref:hypothetical protein n=1 Tax=Sphingomonas sp. BT-65 TaxID=2989821 RepID=UPI0022357585|nr:hypothetical protein [Sphingomonas sp. BT-65]MCW4462663.1 hypothetical protein [Sphingomonas sp. BT-65]